MVAIRILSVESSKSPLEMPLSSERPSNSSECVIKHTHREHTRIMHYLSLSLYHTHKHTLTKHNTHTQNNYCLDQELNFQWKGITEDETL